MNYDDWIAIGIREGFCGPPVCYTHDGLPATLEEEENFYKDEPCIHIIRPYGTDAKLKCEVELNHGASVWRKNRG